MMKMRIGNLAVLAWVVSTLLSCESTTNQESADAAPEVEMWVTTSDKSTLFKPVSGKVHVLNDEKLPEINVDTTQRFQTMDGFGFSLTGGSAWLLQHKLSPEKRAAIIQELFSSDGNNIGVSYLRISIGASDLDDHVFSYADYVPGKSKKSMEGFSMDEDRKSLIPVLKQIMEINPSIKIMGSPWSAPVWMKTNNHAKGGSLRKEYYAQYADYFVRYIKEMEKEGIHIDAITIQNEPENPNNTPSMLMTAQEQAEFVKNNLGPAFEQAKIKTKIVIFDHNCDHPEYPIAVLNDAEAKKYIDGSAFHLYLGEISAMSKVHEQHPDRHLYFTEQWTSGEGKFDDDLMWHTKNLVIGAPRNWSRNVLEWNLASDPNFDPHTDDGGCTLCQGALTIGGDSVTRNVSYYIIAHASKFVPDGSVRVSSDHNEEVPNVAYLTPGDKKVLIILNEGQNEKKVAVRSGKKSYSVLLPAKSVSTLRW